MKVECDVNVVEKAVGSSRFTSKGTTVFCIVNGPVEQQGTYSDNAIIEVRWSESTILNHKTLERYFSNVMEQLLSRLLLTEVDPFKAICIDIHVIESRRNTLFCAFNACFLALASAGMPLKGKFCAISSLVLEEEVFIWFQGSICYRHAFGEITDNIEENALKNLPEIRESLDFVVKSKVIPPQS